MKMYKVTLTTYALVEANGIDEAIAVACDNITDPAFNRDTCTVAELSLTGNRWITIHTPPGEVDTHNGEEAEPFDGAGGDGPLLPR